LKGLTHLSGRAKKESRKISPASFPKCPTGIQGLDEITLGGLPRGRPTLVVGAAGAGKTLLGMQFLVCGALDYDEPGVCLSFEETAGDITQNVVSLGFDLDALAKSKKLLIDYVHVDRIEITETGEYDLEGLFVRLGSAIDSIKAKRVVLDAVETLFAGLTNEGVVRSEFARLLAWLKDKGVTSIVTGEHGVHTLTKHGLEEYISDCVLVLDQRVEQSLVTRRLRIVKYRGSSHGTNEYPFLIDQHGISVLPVTSVELEHAASDERVSTGIEGLDEMLGGKGYFQGSSILVSGTAGTGKTSLAAHLVDAACRRGEKCVYFAFEESKSQLARNMRSIGIDLEQWVKKGLLYFHATRPTMYGLEMHLVKMHQLVREMQPRVAVVDPISSLTSGATQRDVKGVLLRMVDHLKQSGITAFMTALTGGEHEVEATELDISSLVDTWLLLRDIENGGERNRVIYLLKSRGMAHSNQVREFRLTEKGVRLRDAYIGPGGVLTGSARLAQEAQERETELLRRQEMERKKLAVERRRRSIEAQIEALRADLQADEKELEHLRMQEQLRQSRMQEGREEMARARFSKTDSANEKSKDRGARR
jgi:circadian clock protein KaiC